MSDPKPMTIRLLHLADLHLDSAYGGSEATRRRLRQAALEALRAAARYAVDEGLNAVLIAGDAFDGDRLGYEARSALRGEVQRLIRAGIDVVYATGNHDPGGPGQQAARLGLERMEDGRSGQDGRIVLALGAEPIHATLEKNGEPYLHVVAAGHAHSRVTDDLASTMTRPARGDGLPAIAVLHTQVDTAQGSDGHAPYAPSAPATLGSADFDYWALGHVHVQGRATQAAPAWYAGNLIGRHAKESGPKGGLLVELDGDGLVGDPTPVRFAPVEHLLVQLDPEGPELNRPEEVAAAARALLTAQISTRMSTAGGGAPELVLRLAGEVLGADLARELRDAEILEAAQEAVRLELGAALPTSTLLEVQLRLEEARSSLERSSARRHETASALSVAIALAEQIEATGELPEAAGQTMEVPWSRARGPEELRAMARRARNELLRRTVRN